MTAIVLSFVVALALNGAVAAARRTDVVTDLSHSLTFAVLAVVLPFTGAGSRANSSPRCSCSSGRCGWAPYLFRRILRMKVDHRFDGVRDSAAALRRFWLLQAVAVPVIMRPVSYLLDRSDAPGFGA